MKIDYIFNHLGDHPGDVVPEHMRGEGPYEISFADLEKLSENYDVGIVHRKTEQPSRKKIRQGAKPNPDKIGLWLDQKYGNFRQR